jgi:hypothetical protein
MKYISIGLLILMTSMVVAQNSISKDKVKSMWEDVPAQLWVNEYEGLLDGFHKINMTISTDGNHIKGLYQFEGQKNIFILDGEKNEEYYVLSEIDEKHHTCGYLHLEESGKYLIGNWTDVDNSRDIPILFSILPSKIESCESTNSYRIYEGNSQGDILDIHIKKQGEEQSITLWKENVALFDERIFCDEEPCIFTITTAFTDKVDSMTIKITADDLQVISIKNNLRAIDRYLLQSKINYKCIESSNFRSRTTVNYPLVDNDKFDKYLNAIIEAWQKASQVKIKQSYTRDPADIASDRLKYEAFIWADVDLYTKDIISGNLYYQTSWDSKVEKSSFNFDLKKNDELESKNLFDKNLDLDLFLKKQSQGADKEYKYVNLDSYGLVLRSEYDLMYGQSSKQIPYTEILGQLSDKVSFISKLKK